MTRIQSKVVPKMSQSLPSESPDLERHLLPIKEKGLPGSTGGYGRVGIEISEEFAKKREGQILLWMIVNLCSRMRGVVGQIEINIPSGVKPFDPSIVPLVTNPDLSLAEAVAASASLCARDCEITQTPSDSLQKEKDIVVSIGDMESS